MVQDDDPRLSLQHLAVRIEPKARWEDLVLPEAQIEILLKIVAHERERGAGATVLFAGSSVTSNRRAAEVIAADLNRDLYQIDLASVVSKYIGETEKNLQRIFDVAEQSAAVLFFDEAEALFGKRTDVRESHDRYANMEVDYLLQRIERYSGLAIVATNLRSELDETFVRRFRCVVQFPD